ncbi:hypothetical protein WKI65_44090 [Streptomyces sp. MS1.AVA.3]|uniref:hypothetical protein n=1 Tax=Streptomyces decoyicus TaxID=249567 RepID=UPI0030C47815
MAAMNEKVEQDAKAQRVAAVEDKGYGVCWDCEVAYEKHCYGANGCNAVWCPMCDDDW